MHNLPTGTVTFLFTDIEGSTTLLQSLGDRRYAEVLEEHRRLLRTAFAEGHGQEVDTQGDAFLVAFSRARDALGTAVAAQQSLMKHPWPDGASLQVRMGLHTGEPISGTSDYVGLDVHRAARICSAGQGSQILLSRTVADLAAPDLPPGVSLRDLGAHRLTDLKDPEHLFQVLHPELVADFPPLKSLDARPNNLPIQLTSFIGREREIAEVRRLLSTTRLLMLIGAGGSGKTRLALQAAAELLDEFMDGVWRVDLAELSDPALVPQGVASALSLREQPGRRLIETVVDFLRSKSLLLVLDNCEHLLSACADLADAVLRSCRNIRILATSREALGLNGETVWRVPSLSLPDLKRRPSVDELTRYEAVRLFIERATASLPNFSVTSQNAQALAQVCNRLDGIPLAIELAAARVRVLAVEQIAQRLDKRFDLLTDGSRTALPRHRTLLSTMDWSYDLLAEKEQTLFRRSSVFVGSFSLDAVEAVCSSDGIDKGEVLGLLTQLVDKSLVSVEHTQREVRYRFLETVRQYSREKLRAVGELTTLRRAHAAFFLALTERVEPQLQGPQQDECLERLEQDYPNVRGALEYFAENGSIDFWLRLISALWRFWFVRGYFGEGRGWLEEALKRSEDAPVPLRAKALSDLGALAWCQGDYTVAKVLGDRGLALLREAGDTHGVATSLNRLGALAVDLGEYERGAVLYEESLSLYRTLGANEMIGVVLNNLGRVAYHQGNSIGACSFFEESLRMQRELGNKQGIVLALNNLGYVALRGKDYALAYRLLDEALTIQRELKNKRGLCGALHSMGQLALRRGDHAAARSFVEEGLTLSFELGDKRHCAELLGELGRQAVALREMERATVLFAAWEVLLETIETRLDPTERAEYDQDIAALRAALDEPTWASAYAEGRTMTLEQAIEYALAVEAN